MTLEYCTYMYIKFYPLQLTVIYWFTISMHLTSYGGTQEVAKQEKSLQVEQGYHAAVASVCLATSQVQLNGSMLTINQLLF